MQKVEPDGCFFIPGSNQASGQPQWPQLVKNQQCIHKYMTTIHGNIRRSTKNSAQEIRLTSTLTSHLELVNEARLLHPNMAFVNACYTAKNSLGDAGDEWRSIGPTTWLRMIL
jgi:hypothetical protein